MLPNPKFVLAVEADTKSDKLLAFANLVAMLVVTVVEKTNPRLLFA